MVSGVITALTSPPLSTSSSSSRFVISFKRPPELHRRRSSAVPAVRCDASPALPLSEERLENSASVTGGAYDFSRATTSLTGKMLDSSKRVTLVRHGLSSWNEERRVQGSSNLSVLTETGVKHAERCRQALSEMHFDQCFSSPISRAKTTAEVLWQEREEPLIFLDSLKEAHLFFLEGMKNEFGGS